MFLNPNVDVYVNNHDLAERCDAFDALGFNWNDVAALALGLNSKCGYF